MKVGQGGLAEGTEPSLIQCQKGFVFIRTHEVNSMKPCVQELYFCATERCICRFDCQPVHSVRSPCCIIAPAQLVSILMQHLSHMSSLVLALKVKSLIVIRLIYRQFSYVSAYSTYLWLKALIIQRWWSIQLCRKKGILGKKRRCSNTWNIYTAFVLRTLF